MFYMKLGRGKIVCAESFSWHAYCQASLARRERKTLTDFHYKNIFEFSFFSLWKIFIFIGWLSGGGSGAWALKSSTFLNESFFSLKSLTSSSEEMIDGPLNSFPPIDQPSSACHLRPATVDVENKIFFFLHFPGVFLFCFSNTNFFQLRASATSSFRTFDSRVSIGFAETGFLSAWKDSESRRSCRGYQGVDVSERLSGAKSRLSEDFIN